MLKLKIALILVIGVFCSSVLIGSADALFAYNTASPSFTWTQVLRPILMDTDDDGTIDTVYTASTTTSNTITFTKQWGTGLSTIGPISFSITDGTQITAYFGVLNKNNFIVSFFALAPNPTVCSATLNFVNIYTGSVQTPITVTRAGGGGGSFEYCSLDHAAVMQRTDNQYVTWYYTMHNLVYNYGLVRNGTNNIVGGADASGAIITPFGIDVFSASTIYKPNGGTATGDFNGNGPVFNNTGNNQMSQINMNTTQTFRFLDYNATKYFNGLKFTHQPSLLFLNSPTWPSVLGDEVNTSYNSTDIPFLLPYKILKSDLTCEPIRFPLKNGATNYIGLIDRCATNTMYYSTIPSFSDYAVQSLLMDSYTPTIGSLSASTILPQVGFTLKTLTGNFPQNQAGILTLISGTSMTPSTSIVREVNPEYLDSFPTLLPLIVPPTTGLTQLSVNVRNAPSDQVIKVESPTFTLLGSNQLWGTTTLTADDSFTIDLPTSLCGNIYTADGNQEVKVWQSLGQLCASGTMPKSIVYTTNLSFTFWTLPWGVSSNYNDPTSALQTMVRSNEVNYTYNLRVYDRNGTLSLQQQYNNVNGLNVQSFNVSSIQSPRLLEILDAENNTLYHVTLGNGNWLDDFQTFSNQQLEIDGFNLVAMMPIIFAAMWTRNTISMGTMITVVMIATMGFFGVLPIPEVALYAMLFIAAVAMIAYKLIF